MSTRKVYSDASIKYDGVGESIDLSQSDLTAADVVVIASWLGENSTLGRAQQLLKEGSLRGGGPFGTVCFVWS